MCPWTGVLCDASGGFPKHFSHSKYMGTCSNSRVGVPACDTGSNGESMCDQVQVLHVGWWLNFVCTNMIGTCPLDL